MHIKTSSSASLPIWSCRLDEEEGGRWDGLTRVMIPDDTDEGAKKGKKRAFESEEEPEKKKKKSNTTSTEKPTTPAVSAELPKGIKKSAPETLIKASTKEPTEGEQKPGRASAVDFFDSDDVRGYPSPSKPSVSKTPILQKSAMRPSGTRTILKSSKKVVEPATLDAPTQVKHVKFAAKLSDSKTKRNRALNCTDKKVRSGGGKNASAKDRVLGKKVAVK